MSSPRLRLAVVVLAAGAASRYSERPGAKLLAELDGESVLSHVLRAVRAFAPAATVVVLGSGGDEIERTIEWSGEIRVRNPVPERGLSSSIQVGIAALEAATGDFDGAFIVLGDQPRLRAEVMHQLGRIAAESRPADRPLVVPRYAADKGPRNPVLLLRPAWPLARDISHDLAGDRGFADLIEARPDMVLEVRVPGAMPDIDTHEDLIQMRQRGPDEALR